jgi:hypothetical protein
MEINGANRRAGMLATRILILATISLLDLRAEALAAEQTCLVLFHTRAVNDKKDPESKVYLLKGEKVTRSDQPLELPSVPDNLLLFGRFALWQQFTHPPNELLARVDAERKSNKPRVAAKFQRNLWNSFWAQQSVAGTSFIQCPAPGTQPGPRTRPSRPPPTQHRPMSCRIVDDPNIWTYFWEPKAKYAGYLLTRGQRVKWIGVDGSMSVTPRPYPHEDFRVITLAEVVIDDTNGVRSGQIVPRASVPLRVPQPLTGWMDKSALTDCKPLTATTRR